MEFRYKKYAPEDGVKSAHFTPLPDIGEWKFESNFGGDQVRFANPKYAEVIAWIKPPYWRKEDPKWRILMPGGIYDRALNGKTREFKTPERAIKALEADFDPKDGT